MSTTVARRTTTTAAPDGAVLTFDTFGEGPGLLVVHGGGVSARDYERLALALASKLAVHLYDRRGRGAAAAMDENYSIDTEVNDIGALVDATGATRLFGHSIGGRIALQAARHLPLEAVAVFDPAVNIDGLFPTAFLDPMERALDDQDLPLAMAHVGQALLPSNPINRLPLNARTALTRGFLATPIGRRMGALLPTVVRETAELRLPEPASDYRSITSRLLLAWGSSSPAYYPQICDRLAQVIPGASTAALRGTHNAPNIARPSFTSAMADFLATR